MYKKRFLEVSGPNGLCGTIDTQRWPLDGSVAEVEIEWDSEPPLRVPFEALRRRRAGYRLDAFPPPPAAPPAVAARFEPHEPWPSAPADGQARPAAPEAPVRIERTTTQREEVVDEPLFRHDVVVERVAINQFVDGPLPSRHEGRTVVIPVVEEVLVVQKKYLLVEEVRVTRKKHEARKPQRVTLRQEQVRIEGA